MGRGGKLVAAGSTLAATVAVAALAATAWAAPVVTITSGPEDGSTIPGPTATFTYAVNGVPGAEFHCSFDGGPDEICPVSGYTTSVMTPGSHHTFSVYAIVASDPTAKVSRSFTVDASPPTPVIESPLEIGDGKLTKKGEFLIHVTCPAASQRACQGTLGLMPTCCDGPQFRQEFGQTLPEKRKSLFGTKAGSRNLVVAPFVLKPGEAATYKATQGKSGKAANAKGAFTAKAKQGKAGSPKLKRVLVIVDQPGASPAHTETTLYSAKAGKSGKFKK